MGVPAASRYPPVTPLLFSISFWPTLTAWKFMPKMLGTLVVLVPRWFFAVDLVQDCVDLQGVVALNVLEAVGPGGQIGAWIRDRGAGYAGGCRNTGEGDHAGVDFRPIEVVEGDGTKTGGDRRVSGMLVGPCRVSASAVDDAEDGVGADEIPRVNGTAALAGIADKLLWDRWRRCRRR